MVIIFDDGKKHEMKWRDKRVYKNEKNGMGQEKTSIITVLPSISLFLKHQNKTLFYCASVQIRIKNC